MRTINVHIGIPKTGTTTIQGLLKKNRQNFKHFDYYIPNTFNFNSHILLAMYSSPNNMMSIIKSSPKWTKKKILSQYPKIFVDELNGDIGCNKILISNEHLSSRMLNKTQLNRFKDLLNQVSDDIKIILYLRRQDKYLTSIYSTSIKVGNTKKFNPKKKRPILDYENFLKNWADVFGEQNLIVKKFEPKTFVNGELTHDFLNSLGIEDYDAFSIPSKRNESLDAHQLEFLRLFNSRCPNRVKGKKNPLRSNIVGILEQTATKNKIKLSSEIARSILEKYEATNRAVAKKYFDSEVLFDSSDLLEDSEGTPMELTKHTAVKIASNIWQKKMKRDIWQENRKKKKSRKRK